MTVYLSLDQALANTGWSLVSFFDNRIQDFQYGLITTDPKDSLYTRLNIIEKALTDLLILNKVNKVFTETVFINHRRPADSRTLVRVETVVHRLLYNFEIPVEIIKSGKEKESWKKLLNCPDKKAAKDLFTPLLLKQGKRYVDSQGNIIPASVIVNCTDAVAIMFAGIMSDCSVTLSQLLSCLNLNEKDVA